MTLPFKSGSRDGSHPNAETIIHEQFPSCCLRSPWEDANCCWLSRESTHEIPHFWGMSYHHPQKYTQLFQQTKPPTYTIWTWIYPYVYIHMCYIYIYIHIVHPYPYVLRFWLLNSLALSLIVIGKKYPIPPNFKIFKAPSLGKTRPGLLNGFLHASLPSSFGVWSPPTGRSTAPPPAAETVRSTGLGIRWFYWVFDDEMLKPGFRFCELFSFCGWCLKSQKCGALQSSVLTGWSFNDLKEESHSFMISAHPLAHEATQVW